MGNTNSPSKAQSTDIVNLMKNYPVKFHMIHSANVRVSIDGHTARREESFCKGICFSNRPIFPMERVYLRFSEISQNWSGVLRFGFTSVSPDTIDPSGLPRYVCPDLTNKPGYWAKALPERMAVETNVVFFYFNKSGDVYFGLNSEEKGLFFSSLNTNQPVWALIDIYGNTKAVEFIDGRQTLTSLSIANQLPEMLQATSSRLLPVSPIPWYGNPSPPPPPPAEPNITVTRPEPARAERSLASKHTQLNLPVRYHRDIPITPLHFHPYTMGKNVVLQADNTIAIRKAIEYCNAYVFTERPLTCGEKVVLQVLGIDANFSGGLAFGMTACDPASLNPHGDLPDDSDLLLDRPEYWVVNKDVCRGFSVGEELSFGLTHLGEVQYGRNGVTIATLMYVDKTLPLWAFFDIYGNLQSVRCLGVIDMEAAANGASSLKVALPPRNESSSSLAPSTPNTPPCPQHVPKQSPKPIRLSPHPEQPSKNVLISAEPELVSLPPPLIPMPASGIKRPLLESRRDSFHQQPYKVLSSVDSVSVLRTPPQVPPRSFDKIKKASRETIIPANPITVSGDHSQEAMENANNECCVCLERIPDCVIYTCGHMCMCYECAQGYKKQPTALCPMCRQEIKDIIKIYRS